MSALTQATPLPRRHFGLWAKLRAHLTLIDTAHANQARFASLPDEAARDAGRSPEELFNTAAFDPVLPFFFQSGFGQR